MPRARDHRARTIRFTTPLPLKCFLFCSRTQHIQGMELLNERVSYVKIFIYLSLFIRKLESGIRFQF